MSTFSIPEQPTPPSPANYKGQWLEVLFVFVFMAVMVWIGLRYPHYRSFAGISAMYLPSALITLLFVSLRQFYPERVPPPLFDYPVAFDRWRRIKRILLFSSFGIFTGGLAVIFLLSCSFVCNHIDLLITLTAVSAMACMSSSLAVQTYIRERDRVNPTYYKPFRPGQWGEHT